MTRAPDQHDLPASRPRGAQGPAQRRGFVFMAVLLLIVVATLVLAAAMQRSSVYAAITERQLDGYRAHHELLGIRDYCENWIRKQDTSRASGKGPTLADFARSRDVAHRFALDDGLVILISVQDGQGSVLRTLGGITNNETRRWLAGVLQRLPQDQPDLTRRGGPHQISLPGAPDEVLRAVAGGNESLFDALAGARDEKLKNAADLLAHLDQKGVEPAVAQTLSRHLVLEPTLWRLNVEAVHPDAVRRYTLLLETRNNVSIAHEWRTVSQTEAERLFDSLSGPDTKRR